METVDTHKPTKSPDAMPFGVRLLITLFNLAVSGISGMALSPSAHIFCRCRQEAQTPERLVLFVLLHVTLLAALVALISSGVAARWGRIIWHGAQLRLAIVCCGMIGWGLVSSIRSLPKPAQPGDWLALMLTVGFAALSAFCAVQTRHYTQ